MRLTTFSDYSLRVLIYVAIDEGSSVTIGSIAKAFGVSANHLMKVVHFLGKNGYLDTVRGRNGGITLARRAGDIRLGALVRLTEDGAMPFECFDPERNGCVITDACRLRGAIRVAVKAFYSALDEYTLEDMVRNRGSLSRILFVDRPPPPPRH